VLAAERRRFLALVCGRHLGLADESDRRRPRGLTPAWPRPPPQAASAICSRVREAVPAFSTTRRRQCSPTPTTNPHARHPEWAAQNNCASMDLIRQSGSFRVRPSMKPDDKLELSQARTRPSKRKQELQAARGRASRRPIEQATRPQWPMSFKAKSGTPGGRKWAPRVSR